MPDTSTATPAADKLARLIADYLKLSLEIDAAAVDAVREHTSRHYPDAVTLVLDSNGDRDEYLVAGLLTADGTPAEGDAAAQDDEALDDVIRNLGKGAIHYDPSSRLWQVALRDN